MYTAILKPFTIHFRGPWSIYWPPNVNDRVFQSFPMSIHVTTCLCFLSHAVLSPEITPAPHTRPIIYIMLVLFPCCRSQNALIHCASEFHQIPRFINNCKLYSLHTGRLRCNITPAHAFCVIFCERCAIDRIRHLYRTMSLHHFHTTFENISHHYLFCYIFNINFLQAPFSQSSCNTHIRIHTTTFQRLYLTFGPSAINTFHRTAPLSSKSALFLPFCAIITCSLTTAHPFRLYKQLYRPYTSYLTHPRHCDCNFFTI